jgi:3-deoxy-D-manno-octulosonic-acid transferase
MRFGVTRPTPPRRLRLAAVYAAYQVVAHLLLPVVLLVFRRRARREPLYGQHLGERFGAGPEVEPGAVWIFATSLGETRAASPVIDRLLADGHRILLTHASPAGRIDGRRLYGPEIDAGRIVQTYVPLDLFWAVGRFLRRTRPCLGLIVEFEIWPGLLMEAQRRGIPMVQINGNLTDATVARDVGTLRAVRFWFMGLFARVLTKSEPLRRNYLAAGVEPDRVEIVGELKFDQARDPAQVAAAAAFRPELGRGWPVFMIASSVEDEEPELDRLVETLLALPRPPVILWVPRSPQRFAAVAERWAARGVRVATRSRALDAGLRGAIPPDTQMMVGDSIGEMTFYYGLADLVFVGASLNGHGGHNIIEPLAQGRPVVMGPSIFGIRYPAEEAAEAGAFESLPGIEALIARVTELLSDPAALARMSARAEEFHGRHTGAADRTMAALAPYLGGGPRT